MGSGTRARNRRACWVTLLHPSGVASVPLRLGLGSRSLGRRGPRDMETDHMCGGMPVRVRQSFVAYVCTPTLNLL